MKQFLGTGVALVTPFKKDNNVDYNALEKLVNYQIDNGIVWYAGYIKKRNNSIIA